MSNKINDEIADQAIDIVQEMIERGEIAEEQRSVYQNIVYKSLFEDEQTRIFNKFRD